MANIEQRATVNIDVNSKSAQNKLAQLSNKLDDLNKKKAAFEKAGDAKGMARMDTEIKKVEKSMNRVRTNAEKVDAAMKKLNKASPKELRMTLKQLQNDLEHIERGSDAWHKHTAAIKRVKAEIKAVDAELKEHQSLMSRLNGTINNWGMSIASAVAAFTGLTMAGRQAVQAYAEMEAEMANVRKYTGMTAEEVEHLNEAFKGMDTRTSREDLNKLAQEAGRLGLQTEEDVLGFVKAADVINVALDDLGEGATLTLSKLTDIFGDKQALGVEQSLLSVGSVINELSQNCTASAPYLANFAGRLAGVGKQANMTIPQIMGFAAVLDSQEQAVEMSATAVSQLIMKLFQDPAKIAKATGMELSKFNAILKKDTNEALIMLLEQLNKLGGISVLAPVFEAMGTDGARASGVIAALAGNIEEVKKQQIAAAEAYKEGTSVTKEFEVQNNTVQAQLDKAKKGFNEMAVELGQKLAPAMKYAITGTSAFMRVLSTLITFMANHKAMVISLAVAIAGYTLAVKASAIAQAAWNGVTKITQMLMGTVKVAVIAAKLAYFTLTDQLRKADVAQKALNTTMKANPIGLVISALSMLIGTIVTFIERTEDAKKEAAEAKKRDDEWRQSIIDIDKASADYSSKEKHRLDTLYKAATDENSSRKDRIAACRELQDLYPQIFSNFNSETIMAGQAKNAYDQLSQSIIDNAKARAAADKIYENEKEILELELKLEKERAQYEADKKEYNKKVAEGKATNEKNQKTIYGAALGDAREMREQGVQEALSENRRAGEATANAKKAMERAARAVKETEKKIKEYEQANEFLANIPGVKELQKKPTTSEIPQISYTRPESEAERKKRLAEEKKRKAEEAKQARLAAALEKKEFKDALSSVEANYKDQQTAADSAYNKGLTTYMEYLEAKHAAADEYYTNALKVYEKFEASDSKEAAELRAQQEKEQADHYNRMKQLRIQTLAEERDATKLNAQMEVNNAGSEHWQDNRWLNDQKAKADIVYLRGVLDEQIKGTKEYYDAEIALDKATKEEEFRQRQLLEEDMMAWSLTYQAQSAKRRMELEMATIDQLVELEKMSTEEAEQAKAQIRAKYSGNIDQATGTSAPNAGMSAAAAEMNSQLDALEANYKAGLISEEEYQSRRWQIIKNYHDKVASLISGEGNEWATMVVNFQQALTSALEDLGTTWEEKLKSITDITQAAFAIMGAGLQQYTAYASAERDLEVAQVTASYDKQIEAAGKNSKRAQQLESKKQKEIARIKSAYNKKAQTIEIAQAIASTAMAAINAYASASKVSWILGPIAAAMATAAGAMQIATIRKQHQAEAAGYYEGGYTPRDRNNRREVGVVHANEFVANHEAVANPNLAPVLRMIDEAQRNNTVGSLTAEDVSRAIGQGRILGQTVAAQQQMVAHGDQGLAVVAASVQEQTDAIARLQQAIDEGIEAYVVMDGERGLDKQYKRYQRLTENPRR